VKGKKASVLKVSHHGSPTGYDKRVWEQLLDPVTHAAIAPWNLAGGKLPQKADVERLLDHTDELFVTALPSGGKSVPRGSIVASELRLKGIKGSSTYKRVGQVRLRRGIVGSVEWSVDLIEPACTGEIFKAHLDAA